MSEDPCEDLIEEAMKATTEYVMWSKRAVLPPSLTPIDKEKEPIILTQELLDQLEEARQKAIEAEERWHKALDAMSDCVRKHST